MIFIMKFGLAISSVSQLHTKIQFNQVRFNWNRTVFITFTLKLISHDVICLED